MKKAILYRALFGCLLLISIMLAGAGTGSAPFISYVKSNSMEPLIKVNDAILIWPEDDFKIGDIIMFRPLALNAQYVTHRIIDIGEKGFITKGDNAPYMDQESDEPEVSKDRIVGKVLTVKGRPIVLPAVGRLTNRAQNLFGGYTIYISFLFIAAGLIMALTGKSSANYRRKPKRRYRLRDLYRLINILAVITLVVSIYLGSGIKQVKYLVSYYPAEDGNQILPDKIGEIKLICKNNGLVPVWSIINGIKPLEGSDEPIYIAPFSGKSVTLDVLPHQKTGIYHGYVQVYNYPLLLPKELISRLHSLSPGLAISGEAAAIGIYFWFFFRLIGNLRGFYGFIPLKAIKDKISGRRIRRTRAILLGYRSRKQ